MSEKAITKAANTAMAIASFDEEQVQIIRDAICKNFSNSELALFLHQASRTGLDPLQRQIYGFKNKEGRVCIGAYIDGLRLIAVRTGEYSPGRPTEYTYDDKNKVISAKVYVKRRISGEWIETMEEAFLDEFMGTTSTWNKMPRVMLSKCAEARALRRAFPAEMSGLSIEEEREIIEQNENGRRSTRTIRNMNRFKSGSSQNADPEQAPPVIVNAEVVPQDPAPKEEPPKGESKKDPKQKKPATPLEQAKGELRTLAKELWGGKYIAFLEAHCKKRNMDLHNLSEEDVSCLLEDLQILIDEREGMKA